MIISVCIIAVTLVFIASVLLIIVSNRNKLTTTNQKCDIMSFKASQELVGLPIITFYNNKTKLHFLLDTGADRSLFSTKALPLVEHAIYKDICSSYVAADGAHVQVQIGKIKLHYEGREYENDFNLGDTSAISNAIGLVIKGKPVEIVGVIGDDFLTKYRYILDFEKMIAYSKQ